MLRGFYTAAAGMIAEQRRTEMLSNNMANVNTPGYKADQSSIRAFPEMLLNRMENDTVPVNGASSFGTSTPIGSLNTGAYMQEVMPLFSQGEISETGIPSDAAIVEQSVPENAETGLKGFLMFAVQSPDGNTRYTRNGHFSVNANNELTSLGNPILSTAGKPIQISGEDYKITPEGNVIVNGRQTAQLDVRFEGDVRNLVKEGSGLFRTADNANLPSASGNGQVQYTLKQGFVERSNVDTARSYTDMMTAYRSFEANQKVLQAYDRSMDKAANEIGRIR
ncbi:flagellar hook-basal body protein [Metabacillus sp. GX 13764]|uniref:flagellar hook-basal body protein n=1 Tax=Metabacillus kandeliae TaxID=2900151 RepID=UPI001E2FE421|nr:flagellar hook-basal body protein [Metabacillus kandeliae]MCD7034629.1 flagellar hook-basal body protein [Metabacillus kandeliae]